MSEHGAYDRVVMAHGGGGELMQDLLRTRLLPKLGADSTTPLTDSAALPGRDDLVFTTDSYVVSPLEFPGGDIGRLAVAGTVNDLSVMGARPLALSLGLILEEGLPLEVLDRIATSIADTAKQAGVPVVTGDTKVIERRASRDGDGRADGLFINTAGIGQIELMRRPGFERIAAGDVLLVNGPIAEHGLAIMVARHGLDLETPLRSDVAPLGGLIRRVLDGGVEVKFMRDATRGGVAGVLADIVEACELSVEVNEASVPVSPTARHAAELLGLDPLTIANEGKVVTVVAAADAERALAAMREDKHGAGAVAIGRITDRQPVLVELVTRVGGRRVVQRPYGEDLPRIC